MTPDDTIPQKMPDLFRALAKQWQARAADPLDVLEDNPAFSDCCEKVATILYEMADRLEMWIDSDL